MKVLVIVFSLLIPLTASATPNIFDKNKLSSEEIFYGVRLCLKAGQKLKPNIKPMDWYIYCNCSMDYYRVNRSFEKKALIVCSKFVHKNTFNKFPHFNKNKMVWPSHKVLGNVAICVIRAKKSPIKQELALPFCSCLTDARRFNISKKRKDGFSKPQVEKCIMDLQFRFPSKFQPSGTQI